MLEQLKKEVEKVKNDVHMHIDNNGNVILIILDFEDFSEKGWFVIHRDFNIEGVEYLKQWLYNHCKKSYKEDFYNYLEFEGFKVVYGYSSQSNHAKRGEVVHMTIAELLKEAEKKHVTIYKIEESYAEIGDFIFMFNGDRVVSRQKSPRYLSTKSYIRGLHK